LWRRPLKILIAYDRLLTGFDAPIEQVMYLDKSLRSPFFKNTPSLKMNTSWRIVPGR
jgi:hypothetical protein